MPEHGNSSRERRPQRAERGPTHEQQEQSAIPEDQNQTPTQASIKFLDRVKMNLDKGLIKLGQGGKYGGILFTGASLATGNIPFLLASAAMTGFGKGFEDSVRKHGFFYQKRTPQAAGAH